MRYPLAWVLTMALLAKLAGEDRLTGIAEWVEHRKEALARATGVATCPSAPPDHVQPDPGVNAVG